MILKKLAKKEKQLNSRLYVDLPYSGNKPYIFVSYSHKDTQKVVPILSELQRRGFRIWYDEGIRGGDSWMNMIGTKVENCANFLCFASENSVVSKEVKAEVIGARMKQVKMIIIRDSAACFDFATEMYISQFHNLDYTDEDLYDKLEQAIDADIKET